MSRGEIKYNTHKIQFDSGEATMILPTVITKEDAERIKKIIDALYES